MKRATIFLVSFLILLYVGGVPVGGAASAILLAEGVKPGGADDSDPSASKGDAKLNELLRSMGDDNFKIREDAYEALADAGESARKVLERGTRDEDAEIRWRSKRLLRLLDESRLNQESARRFSNPKATPATPATPNARRDEDSKARGGADGFAAPRPRSGQMFDDFFRRSPLRDGLGMDSFFRDGSSMQQMLEDFERRQSELLKQFEQLRRMGPSDFPVNGFASSSNLNVQIQDGDETLAFESGQDGAKATVTRRDETGDTSVETFEAKDLEDFRKNYPDLAKRLGLDRMDRAGDLLLDGFRFRFGNGGGANRPRSNRRLPLPRPSTPQDLVRPDSRLPSAPPKRLGILCGEIPGVLRNHLSLDANEGILVEEVETGSVAQSLGLRAYDILVSINGVRVSTPRDIRAKLETIEEGDPLELQILRSGGKQSLKGRFAK